MPNTNTCNLEGLPISGLSSKTAFCISGTETRSQGQNLFFSWFRQLAGAELVWQVRPETCSVIQVSDMLAKDFRPETLF